MNFLKLIGTSVPAKFVNAFPSTIIVVLKLMAMMIVDNALDRHPCSCLLLLTGDDKDDDPENSGIHVDDSKNVPDSLGKVLINVGHPSSDPDVFLAPQVSRAIKPHQVLMMIWVGTCISLRAKPPNWAELVPPTISPLSSVSLISGYH